MVLITAAGMEDHTLFATLDSSLCSQHHNRSHTVAAIAQWRCQRNKEWFQIVVETEQCRNRWLLSIPLDYRTHRTGPGAGFLFSPHSFCRKISLKTTCKVSGKGVNKEYTIITPIPVPGAIFQQVQVLVGQQIQQIRNKETDVEKLQQRDYLNLKDASLLRFLVDMRGADVDDRQLRDDLMTMLIAGHETTAAVLTWAVFLLAQNPSKMKKAQEEIDSVLGQRTITFECLKKLEYIRLIIVEALRLYPQPPLLIRRSLVPDVLPGGYKGDKDGYPIPAGTDLFVSVYNLHRSPYFWDRPHEFEPERFLVPRKSEGIEGWAGFDPCRSTGALYPNEIISDFAFLPFGGGPRKCVGDQFALMESTVALVLLLQKFTVELKGSPESVELVTGATIHTKSGLWCKLRKRASTVCDNVKHG